MNPANPMFDMFGSSSTQFGGGDSSRPPPPRGDHFDMGRGGGGRPSEDPFLMQKRPIGTLEKL